jgi:hypothetical protein
MNRYFRAGLIILFVLIDFCCLKSQPKDLFISTLKEKLSSWCQSVPFEDIFIHSDRDTYIAGEYFWFNAYLFDRQTWSLSGESSYAYIELLDPDNQPVSQTKVRLEHGSGGGGFRLPDSLNTGEYTLRAYTNLMKNYLPEGCFMKTVTVYNPFREIPFKKKTHKKFNDNSEYNVAFFPEGGRILTGFVNKVGVNVQYKEGRNRGYKGYLSDGINNALTRVVVDSTGIGSFLFFAERGKGYKLISDDGKKTIFLPAISQTGFSLGVNNRINDTLRLTVNTENVTGAGINYFYVAIQSRGKILYGNRVNFSEKSTSVSISGNILNPGINQIIIFDSAGNPVCNRFVFNPLPLSENLMMKTVDRTGKREKISLEISMDTSIIFKTNISNYSLSVSAIIGTAESSDMSDYLITGDEYITPGADGLNNADIFNLSSETIDNYLLSISSNWIKWEDVVAGKLPEIKYPAEKGRQFLSGIYRSRNKIDTNNKRLFLSIPGKTPLFKYAETDTDNRFTFAIRDIESSSEYVIQPSEADNSFSIQIESPFSETYPESGYFIDSTRSKLPDKLVSWSINYQVGKIYGISNIGDTIKSMISRGKPVRFYGKPDQELVMSDYVSLPAMQEVFFELIPGASIKTKKSKYGIFIQDPLSRIFYDNPPALIVDGVIVDDPVAIINLDPEFVEKIDVVKGEYIVGDVIFSGIVSVITKAGDFSNIALPANAIRIRDNRYDFVRRYISPDYSSAINKADRIPDFRNTLYWNHNLKPDSQGKIIVDIITSDFVSAYEINFQGAGGGKLFSGRKTIRVE